MDSRVVSVSRKETHQISKEPQPEITLLRGLGVEGDVHCGATVKHRSRVRKNPNQPNLRQVHLIHSELFDELAEQGFSLVPGEMGENITTHGVDLLGLPTGTRLRIGDDAMLVLTGIRNPCSQLDGLQPGLMAATLDRDSSGTLVRKAGVMAEVAEPGVVKPGDLIVAELPELPHQLLQPV